MKFPTGSADELRVKHAFHALDRFPDVIGAIDCTYVPIVNPGGANSEIFRCRKGYFSINVQAVYGAKLLITNNVARWQGSAHDSHISRRSSLCYDFEHQKFNGLLIGIQD